MRTNQPGEPAEDRLEATRRELRRGRLEIARTLDDAETSLSARQDALAAVRDSPERQWMLRQRARMMLPLGWIRHPLGAMRDLTARLAAASGLHRLDPFVEHARYAKSPLRGHPPAGMVTDQLDGREAIRWLGPVEIQGVSRHALLAHPDSTVTWRVAVAPGAALVAHCGLVPAVAAKNMGGVRFEISARDPDGAWTVEHSCLLIPGRRWLDRHWRALSVDLPAGASGVIEIRLSTALPLDGSGQYAWSIWGEPSLVWKRRPGDISRLARALVERDGLIGAFRRLRRVGTTDLHADYRRWMAGHEPSPEALAAMRSRVQSPGSGVQGATWPLVSVITPVYNTDPQWLRRAIESVRAQAYPHWELCLADDSSTSMETLRVLDEYTGVDSRIKIVRLATNGHISAASNAALDVATGDYVALLDHDDELSPDALYEMAAHLEAHPEADFLYSDEDKRDLAGARIHPYFKPDWSPEHFLNFMYTNHLMVLRRSMVEAAGRFRRGFEGSQDYDLALRMISAGAKVGHVPKVLYHWRQIPGSAAAEAVAKPWGLAAAKNALEEHVAREGLDANVVDGGAPGLFRVQRRLRGTPAVTLVVTTDDRSRDVNGTLVALLPQCLKSIVQRTAYPHYEILVIDNGRLSDTTRDFLASIPHRRVSYTIQGHFNMSHKVNFSVRHATGEHVVIFNDDVEVISSDWLSAMLEYSQDPAIGAVGAKLFYPDGRLQHVGVVMGVCGIAAHLHHQAHGAEPGYFGLALGARNYSAVTGACLMTRRAVFDEVGGFDERLAIDFNDIDYCLRLRRAGYRIVFTPYAELYHHESGSHGARTWNPNEADYMRATWPDVIARDPYYNPNLSRVFPDCRVGE